MITAFCLVISSDATIGAASSKKTTSKATTKAKTNTPKNTFQNIITWGKAKGIRGYWVKKDKVLRLTHRNHTIELEVNQRCIHINGVAIWIGQPVKLVSGRVYVADRDIASTFNAIVAPVKQKTIRTVVLDPGHGGTQPGAISGGKKEKDYTLLIAKEVKRQLEQKGIKVVLTRTGDQTLGLSARPNIAVRAHADLFVSIHLNASSSSSANGVEVFTTTPAEDQSTNTDRSGSRQKTIGNTYDAQNALLAFSIQKELLTQTSMTDRGVRRDRLAVLHSTPMPAVLVEAGFLTNAKDQKKITTKTHRDKIAKAIANGILSYKKTVENSKSPSKATVKKL